MDIACISSCLILFLLELPPCRPRIGERSVRWCIRSRERHLCPRSQAQSHFRRPVILFPTSYRGRAAWRSTPGRWYTVLVSGTVRVSGFPVTPLSASDILTWLIPQFGSWVVNFRHRRLGQYDISGRTASDYLLCSLPSSAALAT